MLLIEGTQSGATELEPVMAPVLGWIWFEFA
jgi:hypothetical protein